MAINLNPHEISVMDSYNRLIEGFPKCETPARVDTTKILVGYDGKIPLTRTIFGPIQNLPDPVPGQLYIVSSVVKFADQLQHLMNLLKIYNPGRNDLVVPCDQVRDSHGNVIGCRSLGV